MRVALALVLLAALPCAGEEVPQYGWRLDGEAFLRYGEGIETPHTAWCKPSPGGPVKALFIVNKDGAYDVPELARRIDVDVHGFPTSSWLTLGTNYWLGMWLETSTSCERAGLLAELLQDDYDVIVLGHYRFESLYEQIKARILEQVAGGCGLLVFHPHDIDPRVKRRALPGVGRALAVGMPFSGLDFYRNLFMPRHDLLVPDEIGERLLRAYTFGRGRVLEVDYGVQSSVFAAVAGGITPFEPYDYTAPVRYDYHQSLAARCLRWAAGRDPRLAWTKPFPDGLEVAGTDAPSVRIEAAWSGKRTQLERRLRVRDRWGGVELERTERVRVEAGPLAWDLVLPALSGGVHFVDLIARSETGVENWGSFAVHVYSGLHVDAIEPDSSFFERGQPVTGRVLLSQAVGAGERVVLALALEDGYGRVFSSSEATVPTGSDRAPFSIEQGQLVSWGARLRVEVLSDGISMHRDEIELRFRRPDRGEFPIAMWGAVDGYGNHIGNLQMRELGFTALLDDTPVDHARDDLGWMTFGGGRGAVLHSLGDEVPVPTARAGEAFARFLQLRYDSLDELNEAWGTSYTDWARAEAVAAATDGEAASFVRLHDSLACGEWMFAEGHRRRRLEIEKDNPEGKVGPEGSPVGNPEWTLPAVTFWGPYLTVRDNLLVNAVAEFGIWRGNWFGGYVEDRQVPTRLRHVLWLSILGGNNLILYFSVMDGLLAPDLTRMPFTDEFIESWDQIRHGVGPQLAACRPAGNPVALLHSQPSEHVGRAGGDPTDTAKAHEYLLNLLGDAGYCPQYVASGQVEAGRLREGDVRVLFLVQAFALSDRELAEIRAFAERGGTVIADIVPAWFDERCRLRETRGLDGLFGLEPAAPAASLAPRRAWMEESVEVPFAGQAMRLRGRDPGLATVSVDGSGIRAVAHGAGKALLLNGVLWREGRENPGTVAAFRRLVEDHAGTPPAFETRFREPLGTLGAKVYSFRRGEIRIDAVLPPEATDPAIPVVPIIEWPEARQTYDLREAEYLGLVDRLEREVERSAPLIVARLDYRVGGVRLDVPAGVAAGETLELACAVLDTAGTPRAGHVIRVTVANPAGVDCPYYGAMLDGEGPAQTWRIPFAAGDPPGVWRIRAADAISGEAAETEVRLDAR